MSPAAPQSRSQISARVNFKTLLFSFLSFFLVSFVFYYFRLFFLSPSRYIPIMTQADSGCLGTWDAGPLSSGESRTRALITSTSRCVFALSVSRPDRYAGSSPDQCSGSRDKISRVPLASWARPMSFDPHQLDSNAHTHSHGEHKAQRGDPVGFLPLSIRHKSINAPPLSCKVVCFEPKFPDSHTLSRPRL